MTDSTNKCCSTPKLVLGTFGIFVFFGFLALILFGYVGRESFEDRAAQGDFSPEVTAQRRANLEEVIQSQSAILDEAKVDAALVTLIKAAPKAEATTVVVPGSPTFLKQMEQAAKPAPEAAADPTAENPAAPAAPAPAKPAPATSAPAKPATPAPAKPAAPATSAPAKPAPATSAPAKPAPAKTAPATPAPAKSTPAPAAPAPAAQ